MKLTFKDKKLARLVNDDRKMLKELGSIRAKILRRRLTQLLTVKTLEEVRNLPGNYHELKDNRKGQWACDLDQPYRLIFTPQERPIPLNEDGQYIWIEITAIEIIEIINYHKEN
ncbi:MAG: type II toxin-antitoxin system RelE/ParE family toxin [Fermentimonas sp.]|nr:type II toxin-antitoxin system RelE/ParE family toxin [Fermentimonas sp.]